MRVSRCVVFEVIVEIWNDVDIRFGDVDGVVADGGRGRGREGTGEEGGVDLLPLTEKGFSPTGLFRKFWQDAPLSRCPCWPRNSRHTSGEPCYCQWSDRLFVGRSPC